jgi:hypothetical protein
VHGGCGSTTRAGSLRNLNQRRPAEAAQIASAGRSDGKKWGITLVVAPAEEGSEREAPVPELRPWCEVGWIFKNGDAVAVERQGEPLRARASQERRERGE